MNFRAFTLIELLLTVVIAALSVGLVTAWTLSALQRIELQSTGEALTAHLRELQAAARSAESGLSQGVSLSSGIYTIFSGDSLAQSQLSSQQTFSLPSSLNLSHSISGGGQEIVFEKSTGETTQEGSLELQHQRSGESFFVTISPLGLIDGE